MNNRVCYRKIRTYTDLRIERMRVDRELDSLGERLKADWRGISQMFSMGYLVDRITGRASPDVRVRSVGHVGVQSCALDNRET